MSRKRDKLEVIYDILLNIKEKKGKANPTHILYRSNLSYSMLQEYLQDLLRRRFIKEERIKDKKIYSITKEGEIFLLKYKEIRDFVDSFVT